ncbi:MAG TPA: AraC family transcriptional regulator [Burkholderiales bacterium]|nr:AraC family transcriptional regulator [Burkholderiales bacterium]
MAGDRISTVMGAFGRFSARSSARAVNTHTHKELSVLFHLGGPTLVVQIDDETCTLNSGEMLLLDPWRPHSRAGLQEPCNIAVLLIDPRWLHGHQDDDGLVGEGGSHFRCRQSEIDPDIVGQLEDLRQLMFSQPVQQAALIQEKVVQLIDGVMGACGRNVTDKPLTAFGASIDFRVRRAFDHLRRSAIPGVKIESLAAGSGMSRSHFFRQFKRCIGVSPQHVIDEERVAYALRALSSPNVMLSQLSDELGFSAPAHFTRFFVQHLGCTPSQFRRNLLLV